MSTVALPDHSVKPVLRNTLDSNQKTFRCSHQETLQKWRDALALRYYNDPDPDTPFTVVWEDRDSDNKVISVPINCADLSQFSLAKTFIQIYRDDAEKCLSITLYFLKKTTRKKGAGSCLIQGNQCQAWVRNEFDILCSIVGQLLDSGLSAETVQCEHRALSYTTDGNEAAASPLSSTKDSGKIVDVSDSQSFITTSELTSDHNPPVCDTISHLAADPGASQPVSPVHAVSDATDIFQTPVTDNTGTPTDVSQDVTLTPDSPPQVAGSQCHVAETQREDDCTTPSPGDSDLSTPIHQHTDDRPEDTPTSPVNSTDGTESSATCVADLLPSPVPGADGSITDRPTTDGDNDTDSIEHVNILITSTNNVDNDSDRNVTTNTMTTPTAISDGNADSDVGDSGTTAEVAPCVCVQCSQTFSASVCRTCIRDFDADIQSQMNHKLKLLTQTMQEKIDSLQEECSALRNSLKEQCKLVTSISDRQKN